jgi:hypothetical protein
MRENLQETCIGRERMKSKKKQTRNLKESLLISGFLSLTGVAMTTQALRPFPYLPHDAIGSTFGLGIGLGLIVLSFWCMLLCCFTTIEWGLKREFKKDREAFEQAM